MEGLPVPAAATPSPPTPRREARRARGQSERVAGPIAAEHTRCGRGARRGRPTRPGSVRPGQDGGCRRWSRTAPVLPQAAASGGRVHGEEPLGDPEALSGRSHRRGTTGRPPARPRRRRGPLPPAAGGAGRSGPRRRPHPGWRAGDDHGRAPGVQRLRSRSARPGAPRGPGPGVEEGPVGEGCSRGPARPPDRRSPRPRSRGRTSRGAASKSRRDRGSDPSSRAARATSLRIRAAWAAEATSSGRSGSSGRTDTRDSDTPTRASGSWARSSRTMRPWASSWWKSTATAASGSVTPGGLLRSAPGKR